MKIVKVKNYEEMSKRACSIILEKVNSVENPVLGLATGSTPEGLYKYIIDAYKQNEVSFKDVTTFNLDEYIGLDKHNVNSYYTYMKEKLFKHLDIRPENFHLPNGSADDIKKECEQYEKLIEQAGHIDIQVLGIGVNGHIGFNEPGTPFTSRTHVVDLAESTRLANARFFDTLADVPTQAITMGIETIMESKTILLLVSGEQKAEALARLLDGPVSEDVPASILLEHPNVIVIADEAARR